MELLKKDKSNALGLSSSFCAKKLQYQDSTEIHDGLNCGGNCQAALLIILLAVYTCSDWLMDLRRRRKTYAREMAAKQAHERISKFERLKKVKSTAKRQASKFTRKLSRTMSRKNTEHQSDEELQVLSLIQLYSFPVGRMSLPWKKEGHIDFKKNIHLVHVTCQ